MSEHTPGPWLSINHSWSNTGIYAGKERIAMIDISDDATEHTQDEWEAKAEANARLIAASPTLYDFCFQKAKEGDKEAQTMLSSLQLLD